MVRVLIKLLLIAKWPDVHRRLSIPIITLPSIYITQIVLYNIPIAATAIIITLRIINNSVASADQITTSAI